MTKLIFTKPTCKVRGANTVPASSLLDLELGFFLTSYHYETLKKNLKDK